ncbi:serine/threonine-protein kinase [Thermocatellispora tengchongensis]|uniref:serine/threonine-protein kinase n=1 Tax=Thermocatellispora tengchongensis TaxID=1073253 RepID=UPI003633CE8E
MPYLTASQPGDPAEIGGYRVRGRLGEGGQGVVYLAETGGGDLVAIKRLRAAPDPVDAARFRREAEVLPRVASFCTAQVLATGTADGVPYIVSEYIDGPSLQRAVRERGPLRGRELRGLAIGTITALAAIHRAGVVHRDFKPGNVLLAADGPRVIDFGIARAVDGDATGGGPVGTPSYMAPEQFGDEPAGPPADLFAWGATMVFAATGHPPFGADSLAAIVHRILTQEPDLGELEGELRDIVAGCLAKDPAARPRAGEVLLRLLGHPAGVPSSSDRLLAQGTAAAVPDAAVPEPSRRRTGGWWALGAVAVAAALIVTVALVRGREPGATITSPTPVPRPSPLLSGPPPAAAGTVSVPALRATLHEHPSDPLRLTSFLVEEGERSARRRTCAIRARTRSGGWMSTWTRSCHPTARRSPPSTATRNTCRRTATPYGSPTARPATGSPSPPWNCRSW